MGRIIRLKGDDIASALTHFVKVHDTIEEPNAEASNMRLFVNNREIHIEELIIQWEIPK